MTCIKVEILKKTAFVFVKTDNSMVLRYNNSVAQHPARKSLGTMCFLFQVIQFWLGKYTFERYRDVSAPVTENNCGLLHSTVVTEQSTANSGRKEWQSLYIANLRTIYSVCECTCGWVAGCVQWHVLSMRVCNAARSTDVPWIAQQAVKDWINQTLSHLSSLRSAVTNCSFHVYSGTYVGKEGSMLDICFLRLRDEVQQQKKKLIMKGS